VDDAAHIIVAAELTNNASDAGELPMLVQAVKNNLGSVPKQALADTGYKSEAVFETLADSGCDLVVALGREGKQALRFDPERSPYTAAMATKLQTDKGKASYDAGKWIAEPPNGWIRTCSGSASSACAAAPCSGGVETRVYGVEPAQDGCDAPCLRAARGFA